MAEIHIVGYGNETLSDTVNYVGRNNSTFNLTTYGHQFGKTCYDDFIYFMCFISILLSTLINILYTILANFYFFLRKKYHQTE